MTNRKEAALEQPNNRDASINTHCLLLAEVLFIILPFIVTGIVFSYQGVPLKIIYLPEWSLASSVLMGQALVKYISNILSSKGQRNLHWERVALSLSALIVFGLAPSLLILSLILVTDPFSKGLAISQIVLFLLGLLAFFFFGGYAPAWITIKSEEDKRIEAGEQPKPNLLEPQ
ncbi:MAG: hypothetical protein QOG71_2234 [Pyrinomonadaceae bacterium]|nr:hypothetical protein [Pyrinomonadaceae bacterium]